ncbi:MAG TPA: nitroreductase family deazaflavin-dependent oxidoreductase [Myxococcota bacterium]|nr:nitroreductase family deazaflavin-dependent oxidoreductase [Myxococcota bacterium]
MADPSPRPWTPTEERLGTLAVRAMSAVNTWLFRLSGGRLGSRFLRGAPVLLLTTTGAKSGAQRTTPLIYLADGPRMVLVASKGGMSHSPAWYHNLMANPECEVQIGSRATRMLARRASAEEKSALWPKLLAIYRDYDDYQARTTRDIPVLILTPRGDA